MNVSGSDLSIIMTGAINPHTIENIRRIQRIYPKAEFLVSSFDKCPTSFSDLKIRFVQCNDPGSSFTRLNGEVDNLGRQIVQITEALAKTKGKVILRLRTDMTLNSEIPLEMLKGGKILIPTIFTRDPARYPLLFHPSDLLAMGARRDIQKLYKASSGEVTGGFQLNYTKRRWIPLGKNAVTLFPEQRLCLNYFNSLEVKGEITLPFATYFNFKLFRMSEKLMKKYFSLIPESCVVYPSKFREIRPGIKTTYRTSDWEESDAVYASTIRMVKAFLRYHVGTNLNWQDLKSKVSYLVNPRPEIFSPMIRNQELAWISTTMKQPVISNGVGPNE